MNIYKNKIREHTRKYKSGLIITIKSHRKRIRTYNEEKGIKLISDNMAGKIDWTNAIGKVRRKKNEK